MRRDYYFQGEQSRCGASRVINRCDVQLYNYTYIIVAVSIGRLIIMGKIKWGSSSYRSLLFSLSVRRFRLLLFSKSSDAVCLFAAENLFSPCEPYLAAGGVSPKHSNKAILLGCECRSRLAVLFFYQRVKSVIAVFTVIR